MVAMPQHHFTLSEARTLLGWLESKLSQLEPYKREVAKHRPRLAELMGTNRSNGSNHLEVEMQRLLQLVEELEKSMQDILEQITGKGIIVRDLERGLVDFPSLRKGREVHLCWLRGEPDIRFWHETDVGFAGRQPL